MKDKADKFDTMYEEEAQKIRLNEAGWKGRCVWRLTWNSKTGRVHAAVVMINLHTDRSNVTSALFVLCWGLFGIRCWAWCLRASAARVETTQLGQGCVG